MTVAHQHIVCTSCGAVNRVPAGANLAAGKCGRCSKPLASTKPADIDTAMLNLLMARDEGAFVLDVWAPWCGPCRMMAPAYADAAAQFAGKLRFLKLNSETHPDAAQGLQVRGIPALFLFKQGSIADQRSGAMNAPGLTSWLSAATALAPSSSN